MTTATERLSRLPTWVGAAAPLVLVGALVLLFSVLDPIGRLRPVPPIESLAVERVMLEEGRIEMHVRNDGPDEVTIAQVLVNEAYWQFAADDQTLSRLEKTTIAIPYPWEEGLPVGIALVTSTGLTVEHEIEAAVATPGPDLRTFAIYALLGVYIGVVPVAIGLLWFPALRRASARWIGFFLAFTVGLLAFLLVDTVEEGLAIAGRAGAALNGVALFAIGALAALLALFALESSLRKRQSEGTLGGLTLSYLVATGIGLHNLGEGLAVGAALAVGEMALGTFLVIGFALHNTTEGLAIVAPLSAEPRRPALRHFAALGAVAGAPTIAGAWAGGFAFLPAWGTFSFGVAAGAIAQVVWVIARGLPRGSELSSVVGALGFGAGLAIMYLTGLLVA